MGDTLRRRRRRGLFAGLKCTGKVIKAGLMLRVDEKKENYLLALQDEPKHVKRLLLLDSSTT